jgi:polyisoprenoid-binding protein YceI
MKIARNLQPLWIALACAAGGAALAKPVTYTMDPAHTYPSFEADHMGLSKWRGKIDRSHGTVVLDKQAQTGKIDVTMDMTTVDFGYEPLNEHVKAAANLFDTKKYPTAHYTGKLVDWKDGVPTAADGTLTWHGVTKPVNLKIDSFKCVPSPFSKGKERCGANAVAHLQRDDFGADLGKGAFNMGVTLRIQVEAEAPM